MKNLRQVAKRAALAYCPKVLFEAQMRFRTHEPEVRLIPDLLPVGGTAVDVGAHEGLYVYHMQKRAARVWAFEPFPDLAANLKRKAGRHVRVESVALSLDTGEIKLRYPTGHPSWATVEAENDLHRADALSMKELSVPLRTLDAYGIEDLDLLKIDVEGHEEAVLLGGLETIRRTQPNIIIEVEEVHNPGSIERVHRMLEQLGYTGFFIDGDELVPFERFDLGRDQNIENVGLGGKSGRYINNFLFVAPSALTRLAAGRGVPALC